MCKLSIEIETQDEQDMYKLFMHVFREITERDYRNNDLEARAQTNGQWLEVLETGRYQWTKLVDKEHNMS